MNVFQMKKLRNLVLVSLFINLFFFIFSSTVQAGVADDCKSNWGVVAVTYNGGVVPDNVSIDELKNFTVTLSGSSIEKGKTYSIRFRNSWGSSGSIVLNQATAGTGGSLVFSIQSSSLDENQKQDWLRRGPKTLQLVSPENNSCNLLDFTASTQLSCSSIILSQAGVENAGCFDKQQDSGPITVKVSGVKQGSDVYSGKMMVLGMQTKEDFTVTDGEGTAVFFPGALNPGDYTMEARENAALPVACSTTMSLQDAKCTDEARKKIPTTAPTLKTIYKVCAQINDITLQKKCVDCAGGEEGQEGIWTAVGCINKDPIEISKRFIQVGLGMGGGVALIMTLAGGFILSTSQGDPQKANQAKEMITNSIIGLLFVIFSVFILQFIGVIILNIPGFGTS